MNHSLMTSGFDAGQKEMLISVMYFL